MRTTDAAGNENPDTTAYSFPMRATLVQVYRQGLGPEGLLVKLGARTFASVTSVYVGNTKLSPQFGDGVVVSPPAIHDLHVTHETYGRENHLERLRITLTG